jgi:ribonucleoside-diphosphate reductase alpha chain
VQPSTLAYVARLLIHRYGMLGVLDHDGYPIAGSTRLWTEAPAPRAPVAVAGRTCPECGHPTLIRRDGCDFCTCCGYTGACG